MVNAKWYYHVLKQIMNVSFVAHKACHVLFTLPKFAISQSEARHGYFGERTMD